MELETYLRPKCIVAPVLTDDATDTNEVGIVGACKHYQDGRKEDPLLKIMEWLDKLETQLTSKTERRSKGPGAYRPGAYWPRREWGKLICWNCEQEGHAHGKGLP